MKVLVVLFGGVDHEYLEEFDCRRLKQNQYGRLVVDELWNDRDVATQITSQFLTGRTWRESGVRGRKRFLDDRIEWLEKNVIREAFYSRRYLEYIEWRTRGFREGIYTLFDGEADRRRNYLKSDLACDTLFDLVPNSKAVYVPSYNPEPSWALHRNILDPNRFPALGEEAAVDLAEKNFAWRREKLFDEADEDHQLLVAQFQILDSLQHLYLVYSDEPRMEEIEAIYERMDAFAGEIVDTFDQYDQVLFLSDNGAATHEPVGTHHNRPFYSIRREDDLDGENIRDFHGHVLRWVQTEPNPGRIEP